MYLTPKRLAELEGDDDQDIVHCLLLSDRVHWERDGFGIFDGSVGRRSICRVYSDCIKVGEARLVVPRETIQMLQEHAGERIALQDRLKARRALAKHFKPTLWQRFKCLFRRPKLVHARLLPKKGTKA